MEKGKNTSGDQEKFLEKMSDELTQIHADLSSTRVLTEEFLNTERTEAIQKKLEQLAEEAEKVGDQAKASLLTRLGMRFYVLQTIGTVDDRQKFSERSAEAFDLLESILLTLDSFVSKNRGKILDVINKRDSGY